MSIICAANKWTNERIQWSTFTCLPQQGEKQKRVQTFSFNTNELNYVKQTSTWKNCSPQNLSVTTQDSGQSQGVILHIYIYVYIHFSTLLGTNLKYTHFVLIYDLSYFTKMWSSAMHVLEYEEIEKEIPFLGWLWSGSFRGPFSHQLEAHVPGSSC